MSDFIEHLIDSPLVVFAFSSGAHFEWGRTLRRAGVAHVLFRDTPGRWYLDGIEGLGHRYRVVAHMLSIGRDFRHTATLGLSRGSYGAILYGINANLDDVLAISPVTAAGPAAGAPEDLAHRVEQRPGDPVLEDLARLTHGKTHIHCYVSDGDGTELDEHMANRVRPWSLLRVSGQSHQGLAAHLRDVGVIQQRLNLWTTRNT